MDWKNWDGFLKGSWEDCYECEQVDDECRRECNGEEVSDVQLVDVDSDGTLEALNLYFHSGDYSGQLYETVRIFTLKDGCVALLAWPESPALRSGYSDWGFPKVVTRNGEIKLTLDLGNCSACIGDGGEAVMQTYYRIVDGKLVELKDKATVKKNRRLRR